MQWQKNFKKNKQQHNLNKTSVIQYSIIFFCQKHVQVAHDPLLEFKRRHWWWWQWQCHRARALRRPPASPGCG